MFIASGEGFLRHPPTGQVWSIHNPWALPTPTRVATSRPSRAAASTITAADEAERVPAANPLFSLRKPRSRPKISPTQLIRAELKTPEG